MAGIKRWDEKKRGIKYAERRCGPLAGGTPAPPAATVNGMFAMNGAGLSESAKG